MFPLIIGCISNLANLGVVHLVASIIMYTSRCNHIAIVNANSMDLELHNYTAWETCASFVCFTNRFCRKV